MRLPGSSFIHITTVTMTGGHEAVKALVRNVTSRPAGVGHPADDPGAVHLRRVRPQYWFTEVDRVPRGQIAIYEAAGYFCYRGQ